MGDNADNTATFEDCKLVKVLDLNSIPDGSCRLLYLGNCGDFVQNKDEVLGKSVKKLRYGGHIIVEGIDLSEVSYGLFHNIISLQDAQNLIFQGRSSCSTISETVNQLQYYNLTILKSRLMQYKYLVRAERPPLAQNQMNGANNV